MNCWLQTTAIESSSHGRNWGRRMDDQGRIEALRQLATKVLEDQASGDRWLSKENKALGMKRPIDLALTEEGYERCVIVLHRIEHGVFS